jgi:spermidine synthase
MAEVTIHRSLSDDGVIEITDDGDIRSLYFGNDAKQSAMSLSSPLELVLSYTETMMLALLFQPQPRNCLLIGLGGGSIAKFLHHHYPTMQIDAIELRADVAKLAHAYFQLPQSPRINILLGDVCDYFRSNELATYDLIMVDAFNHDGMPDDLKGNEFFDACRRHLSQHGIMTVNLWANKEDHFQQTLELIEDTFSGHVLTLPVIERGNAITFAANQESVFKFKDKGRIKQLETKLDLPLGKHLRQLRKHNRWRKLSALFL